MNNAVADNSTGRNVARVASYGAGGTTFAMGLTYMADKRLELNLDQVETAFVVGVVTWVSTVAVAYVWNRLKDRGKITDNR